LYLQIWKSFQSQLEAPFGECLRGEGLVWLIWGWCVR